MGTKKTIKQPYVRASELTWARIRQDYSAGVPVDMLGQHYGPSRTEIYRHIREEGWTRIERPTPPRLRPDGDDPEAPAPPAPPAPPGTLENAVARTVAAAVAAVHADRPGEAATLASLAERLLRLKERTEAEAPPAGFTPARDIVSVLAERFGVEPVL
jgi:hypothetical protein